ncbi:MAG: hypothetical protein H6601_07095 [Flavobacteriales bacterium]|nr:hypothetical protein [Flavobacteriales bacterium]
MKCAFIISGLLLALSFTSCKKNKTFEVPYLDIKNASVLSVQDGGSGKTDKVYDAGSSNLYMITIDGDYENVGFVNSDGSPLDPEVASTVIYIQEIFPLNSEYIIITGYFEVNDIDGNMTSYENLLVRITDGAIFEYTIPGVDETLCSYPSVPYFYDTEGNVYKGRTNALYKISLSDPSNPSYQNILPTGQSMDCFTMDMSGNFIYQSHMAGQEDDYKIVNTSGSIDIIADVNLVYQGNFFWQGSDGKIYVKYRLDPNDPDSIFRLDFINNELQLVSRWAEGNTSLNLSTPPEFMVELDNGSFFINQGFSNVTAWVFNEINGSVELINIPIDPTDIYRAGDHIYAYENTDLYKINLQDFTNQQISSGNYEFYTIGSDETGTLLFSALRYADGKKVIGKIDPSGNVTIIDEESNAEVITFVQLN